MRDFGQDLRFLFRQIRKSPGYTAAVVLTLSLGIGVNAAIFSMVDGVLVRPLPYRDGEQLVHLRYGPPDLGSDTIRFSVPELRDYRHNSQTLSGVMEYHSMSFTLLGGDEPDQVLVGVVSANVCGVLGVEPILGRCFVSEDEQPGAPPVLLLSNRYWHSRFGGDPHIVGRVLRMNDHAIQVVGVLPRLPDFPGTNDILVPTAGCPVRSNPAIKESRTVRMVNLFGRLRPGVEVEQARAEMTLLAGRLQRDHPDTFPQSARSTISVVPVTEELNGEFRPTLQLLLATVILVLLITCANVGNLSLARLLRREREVVLRSALGAGRRRLVRQLLTESTALALLGALVGLLFAAATMGPLTAFARRFTPLAERVGIDARVLLFTLGVAVLTGLLFGLFPAIHACRRNLAVLLRDGGGHATQGPGRQRLRSALVVLQVAVSFMLLIAAGLTTKSALRLQKVDGGFDPRNVTAMSLELPSARYSDPAKVLAFYNALLARIDSLPGVVSSSVSSTVPLLGDVMTPSFRIEGRAPHPGEELRSGVRVVSTGYFRTLGIPLVSGRTFLPTDDANAMPVVVITRSMAQRFWPGEDPVGKRIEIAHRTPVWSTIIGVVGDVRQGGLDEEAGDAIYRPFLQVGGVSMALFVRTTADSAQLGPALREAVREIDPEQSVSEIVTMEQVRSESTAPARLTATLLGLFSLLAFAITIAGLNGVIAYSITERTQEIGIRSALGAERVTLLGMVMRQGMTLVLLGLALGWAGALGGSRLVSSLLFGIQPSDPLTFLSASLVLLAFGAAACFFPARRAAFIDPMVALRS